MKTKLRKPVKFMGSLKGETATVRGAVCVRPLSSATLSRESHYSHALYPVLAIFTTC